MTLNRWLSGLATLLAACATWPAPAADRAGPTRDDDELARCAALGGLVSPTDYRTRDSTPFARWGVQDVKHNHYDPAVGRMREGEYSHRVMADLDFLLRHWPNHLPGLEALIQYDLSGGKVYEYAPAYCYLERARQFAPDDIGVVLREGYYLWKKRDNAGAVKAFEDALALDPKSADANYDLGLIYCEMGEYDKALLHARAAYDAGYPLPGLKHKLQEAGHWSEADAKTDTKTD